MSRALEVAKLLALLSAALLCAAGSYGLLRLGVTVGKVNGVLDEVHATLTVAYKVSNDARVTVDNINSAALDERFYFEHQAPEMDKNLNGILASTQHTIDGVNRSQADLARGLDVVLTSTNQAVAQATPTLASVQATIQELQIVERHLDEVVTDPALLDTLHNVDHGTASADQAVTDVAGEVHRVTHLSLFQSLCHLFRRRQ